MSNEEYEAGKQRYEQLAAKYYSLDEFLTTNEIFEFVELREIYEEVE